MLDSPRLKEMIRESKAVGPPAQWKDRRASEVSCMWKLGGYASCYEVNEACVDISEGLLMKDHPRYESEEARNTFLRPQDLRSDAMFVGQNGHNATTPDIGLMNYSPMRVKTRNTLAVDHPFTPRRE